MSLERKPEDSGWFRFALVGAGALVLAAAWAVWSLVLAPPVVREQTSGSVKNQESVRGSVESAEEGAGGGVKRVRKGGKAAPLRLSARIGLEELRSALLGEGAVPKEALLVFRSAAELAAFRTRAGLYGLKILGSDARLNSARVKYDSLERLADELNEHPGSYENVAANLVARIPGLPRSTPEVDTANQGGESAFLEGVMGSIGAGGDRSDWGAG